MYAVSALPVWGHQHVMPVGVSQASGVAHGLAVDPVAVDLASGSRWRRPREFDGAGVEHTGAEVAGHVFPLSLRRRYGDVRRYALLVGASDPDVVLGRHPVGVLAVVPDVDPVGGDVASSGGDRAVLGLVPPLGLDDVSGGWTAGGFCPGFPRRCGDVP